MGPDVAQTMRPTDMESTCRPKWLQRLLFYFELYLYFSPIDDGTGFILGLHHVSPSPEKGDASVDSMTVTPFFLDTCIRFLRNKGFVFFSIDDVFSMLNGDIPFRRFACVTFDDGYADNYDHAYPLMAKHRIPFAVYLTTGFLDRTHIIWWGMLRRLVRQNERVAFRTEGRKLTFDCRTAVQKKTAYIQIKKMILSSPREDPMSTLRGIFEPYCEDLFAETDALSLTWKQVREMSRNPLTTFGVHTVTHPDLNLLPPAIIRHEILTSKQRVEDELGRAALHFCYPYGGAKTVSEKVCTIVSESGFNTAVTTVQGNVRETDASRLHRLPRRSYIDPRDTRRLFRRFIVGRIRHRFHQEAGGGLQ